MADASDSKSDSGNWVSVRPRPPLPKNKTELFGLFFISFSLRQNYQESLDSFFNAKITLKDYRQKNNYKHIPPQKKQVG